MSFRIIEDIPSGDFAFEAFGKSIAELFESCADACLTAMTDTSAVDSRIKHTFELRSDSLEDLLVDFLSELVYLKDTEKIFFSKVDVSIDVDHNSLKAVAWGEGIDYDKHEIKADVKAVTYHNLKIDRVDDGFGVKVILDL